MSLPDAQDLIADIAALAGDIATFAGYKSVALTVLAFQIGWKSEIRSIWLPIAWLTRQELFQHQHDRLVRDVERPYTLTATEPNSGCTHTNDGTFTLTISGPQRFGKERGK